MRYIEFKDKGFEKSVKKFLKITSEKVTADDLLVVEGVMVTVGKVSGFSVPWTGDSAAFSMKMPNFFFDVSESEGTWEQDLKHFSHITSLHIDVPTKDLSVLRGFSNLQELYVKFSDTKDWSFLTTLTNLSSLLIHACNFSDLAPIQDLYAIQLDEYKNSTEVSPFGFKIFEGLQKLYLSCCGIRDISPLADCKYINELNLSYNEFSDISPLRGITSLYYLTLRYNDISDITPLGDIEGIYLINLRHNRIEDISSLKKHRNANLSRLFLAYNSIDDYTPLKGIQLIEHDLDEGMSNSEAISDLIDRKNGKHYGMLLCEAQDIIGI